MIARSVLAALLVTSAATACSKSEGEGASAAAKASASASGSGARLLSCERVTTASVCSEYTGAYLAQNEAVLTATCQKLGGTATSGECPNTSVIGSCTLATGESRRYFSSGGVAYDVPRAQKECESAYKGKWTPLR